MELSSMMHTHVPVIVVGVAFVFVFLYYLCIHKPYKARIINGRKSKKTPDLPGTWPILGHLQFLGAVNQVLQRKLGVMADEYEQALMICFGSRSIFVENSWELAKTCYPMNDRVLATRPSSSSASSKYMSYTGFAPYGSSWREMRKIAVMELLSNHRIKLLKHMRNSEIDMSIKELYETYWAGNESPREGDLCHEQPVLVDMKRWFDVLTLNVVTRMFSGKRQYEKMGSPEDENSRICRKAMSELIYLMGTFSISDVLPLLGLLDLDGLERSINRTLKVLDGVFSKQTEDHRHKKRSNCYNHDEEENDFIDVLLSSTSNDCKSEIFGRDADTTIKSLCLGLIGGGSDTTMIIVTWALSLLLNHRSVLKKAQAELDNHIGKDRQVEESDINNLVYLQAIVKETLRLYPVAPLALLHEAMEDCTIGGFDVPKGTCVTINILKIHRDPRVWTDPMEFRPERFVSGSGKWSFYFRGHQYEYIPFGSGRRMCPGFALAVHVSHYVLARLIHEFEMRTPLDAPVDMSEGVGLTLPNTSPMDVLIKPRLSSSVHECMLNKH